MIIYESNKHFWSDMVHLFRSWTMVKILRGVLLIGVFSFAVCFPISYWNLEEYIKLDPTIFSFLGVVLSILLVFRTNSAYDRWWEGRKQWGALVNTCRNLAVLLHSALPSEDTKTRHYLATRIGNFCIAFKEHLRNGVEMDELINLTEDDKKRYASKAHIPNHISYEIHQAIHDAFKAGAIEGEDHLNLKLHTGPLLDILGACERIKKTPIPYSYAMFIRIFIVTYAVLLPFVLAPAFGLWAIPSVMFILFAFLGIELMAEEIEDPFGLDCNDLPTGTIAHTIKDNVFEILEAQHTVSKKPELYDKVF